jgi:hypothetical protein
VTFNGVSWSEPVLIDGSGIVRSVSCASSSFCAAVDEHGSAVTFNGVSWSEPVLIDGSGIVRSVSCASSSFCVAVGGRYAVTFNGVSWSAPLSIQGNREVEAVSCASSSSCVAAGSAYTETFNGVSWSEPTEIDPGNPDAALFPNSLSCPSASFCTLVADGENVLAFDGSSWSVPATLESKAGLRSVSCASLWFCAAVDEDGNALIASEASPPLSSASPAVVPVVGSSGPRGCAQRLGGSETAQVASVPRVNVRSDLVLVPLRFRGSAGSPCMVTLTLTVLEKLRRGRLLAVSAAAEGKRRANKGKLLLRTVVVGHTTVTMTGGESEVAHIVLNATGRRILKARHVLALKLTVGENGVPLATRIVKFRAPIKQGGVAVVALDRRTWGF